MKILASEKLSEHKFKDNNGYLICTDCILSRTGKQTYRRDEIFKDGSDEEIEVDRLADEVFSRESLASFENCPVCINHPDCNVGPENHNELSVGFVRNVRKGDFEGQPVMMGDLVITDAKAIDLIESGDMVELSCGYDCDIDDEDNPQQRNIRGNHVALCEQGRAGIARIVDSIEDEDKYLFEIEYLDKRSGRTKISFVEAVDKEEAKYIFEKKFKGKYDRIFSMYKKIKGSLLDDDFKNEVEVLKQKGNKALIWIKNAKIQPYAIVNYYDPRTNSWESGSYYSVYSKAKRDFERIKDSASDFEALKKRIQNAESRRELKEIMIEVDTHKDDNKLTSKEYRDLIRLSENLKDSITTQRINKIIDSIYGRK